MSWLLGMGGSVLIAGAAYARKSLSASGMLAAMGMGTLMYGLGSLPWYGLLIYFFVSSTVWSKLKRKAKQQAESGYEKGGRRDAGQVWANGGIGLLLCIASFVWPHPVWWFAFLGVMGTVTADTWATELGGLSRSKPRSIRTGRIVEPGTSGGITRLGMTASILGAGSIGVLGAVLAWLLGEVTIPIAWVVAATLGGTAGSLTDSWLGATVQRMNHCARCGGEVESSVHCGENTKHLRGWRWMNNDAVNSISSILGGCVALTVYVVVL